jgi:hypothetical protein
MGLFSGITKSLFGDPSKGIAKAGRDAMRYKQEGADYLKGIDALPLEMRNRFMPMLADYYGGGGQEMIEQTQQSPLYQAMLDMGQEGVLANAGFEGLTRSGNTAQDLSLSNQNVLQQLLNERLGGMERMSNMPLNTSNIAQMYSGMGDTAGQIGTAQAQADQSGLGQMFSALLGGAQAAGGLGWKPFGD